MDSNMMKKVFCDVDNFCKKFYQCLTQQMVGGSEKVQKFLSNVAGDKSLA